MLFLFVFISESYIKNFSKVLAVMLKVWTDEQYAGSFSASVIWAPTATPTSLPGLSFTQTAICSTDERCTAGATSLMVGDQMYATFALNAVPVTSLYAEAYWNGAVYETYTWIAPFGVSNYLLHPALLTASGPGTVELGVWSDSQYVGAFSAQVQAAAEAWLR